MARLVLQNLPPSLSLSLFPSDMRSLLLPPTHKSAGRGREGGVEANLSFLLQPPPPPPPSVHPPHHSLLSPSSAAGHLSGYEIHEEEKLTKTLLLLLRLSLFSRRASLPSSFPLLAGTSLPLPSIYPRGKGYVEWMGRSTYMRTRTLKSRAINSFAMKLCTMYVLIVSCKIYCRAASAKASSRNFGRIVLSAYPSYVRTIVWTTSISPRTFAAAARPPDRPESQCYSSTFLRSGIHECIYRSSPSSSSSSPPPHPSLDSHPSGGGERMRGDWRTGNRQSGQCKRFGQDNRLNNKTLLFL